MDTTEMLLQMVLLLVQQADMEVVQKAAKLAEQAGRPEIAAALIDAMQSRDDFIAA